MHKQKLVFYSACLGMLLFGIVIITIGSVLPSITDKFKLTSIEAGSLVSLLPFGILAGSLLFGPVVDRYGYKSLLMVCVVLVGLGLEGIAYAQSLLILNVSVFAIGLGGGVLNGATNALVADISDTSKGANLSLLGVFYGIGALGMPTILNALMNTFSTDRIISLVGFFVFLVAIVYWFVSFPVPKQASGFPVKEGMKLVKSPALLLAGFFLFFASGSEGLLNNWCTTYLENVLSTDKSKGLLALSVLMISLTLSRILLGNLLRSFSSKSVFFIFIFIEVIGAAIISMSSGYYFFLLGIIFLGVGMAAPFPIIMGYVAELFPGLSGTAFSIVLVIALTGNMILNYSMGVIAHTKGIQLLPGLLMVCFVFMIGFLQGFLMLTRGKLKFSHTSN